jgi:hypothetical protein
MLSPGGGNFDVNLVRGEKKAEVEVQKPAKQEKDLFEQVAYENLSIREKKELTEIGLNIMQGIMDGIPDYVVFASTSLFLHGQKYGIEDFAQKPPGDFDCAVQSLATLKRIRSRLSNVPGVAFDDDGRFHRFPTDEARKLSGVIHVGMRTADGIKKVPYEFEFFLNSFIIPDHPQEFTENIHGMKMLDLEGLQKQYQKNLSFEGKIFKRSDQVVKYLLRPEIEGVLKAAIAEMRAHKENPKEAQINARVLAIMNKLDLGLADFDRFYERRDSVLEGVNVESVREGLEEEVLDYLQLAQNRSKEIAVVRELTTVLSGFKTKLHKRINNLNRLRELQRIEIE